MNKVFRNGSSMLTIWSRRTKRDRSLKLVTWWSYELNCFVECNGDVGEDEFKYFLLNEKGEKLYKQ